MVDALIRNGSYGPEGSAAMSERISFTHDELAMLWNLINEAMEGLGPEMEDDDAEVATRVTHKVGRAFAKARRKKGNA